MRQLINRLIVPAFLTASTLACSESPTDFQICPAVISPALNVDVRDSISSAPLAQGSIAWYRVDTFHDSLRTSRYESVNGELVPLGFKGGNRLDGANRLTKVRE